MRVLLRVSPSRLEKLEACPSYESSITVNQDAADEGTLMHEATETGDMSKLETEEQIAQVTRCLEIKKSLLSKKTETGSVLSEYRIKTGPVEGTLDFAVLESAAKASLVDWKYGRLPVTSADKNVQAQAYTLGLFDAFPGLEEITAIIVQPRLDYMSSHTYTRSQCEMLRLRVEAIVARAQAEEKSENPNERSCLFCSRKAECVGLRNIAFNAGSQLGMQLPTVYKPQELVAPADLAKAQILSYILEDWASQVRRDNTKRVVEDGVTIPGFELRARAGNTTVNETANAIAAVLKSSVGVPEATVLQACSLSVAKLTDLVHAVKGGNKKEVREGIDKLLAPFSTKGETVTFLQKKRGMTYEAILEECR